MPDELNCLFCQIVADQVPSTKIYEDAKTIAFMDIFPWTEGHFLVVPKEHAPTLIDLSEESAAAAITIAKMLAPHVITALGAEGFNLFQSNGRAAWQTVDHFHIHLVPRWSNDGLRPLIIPTAGDPSKIKQNAGKILERLEGQIQ